MRASSWFAPAVSVVLAAWTLGWIHLERQHSKLTSLLQSWQDSEKGCEAPWAPSAAIQSSNNPSQNVAAYVTGG